MGIISQNAIHNLNSKEESEKVSFIFHDKHALPLIPHSPKNLLDVGLSANFVRDLIIKHIYRFGTISGYDISEKVHLPFYIIDPLLDDILSNDMAEKRGSRGLGNATDLFSLIEKGRKRAQELLLLDTYIGPAPVPLAQYSKYLEEYQKKKIFVNEELLKNTWNSIVLDDYIFDMIGPAIRSKKSLFLYGVPGTGKSVLAKAIARFLEERSESIAIPYAIVINDQIIKIFDPVYHIPIQDESFESNSNFINQTVIDRRWIRCHPPTIISAGELTIDMLDLQYNSSVKYYESPIHIKANGGVFIIDDFGRQKDSPEKLLNRWILPLEENIDILSLNNGSKFPIPFEQFVIFATNLEPAKLVDNAFLRRIKYKVHIDKISIQSYKKIFEFECQEKNLVYNDTDLNTIIEKYYILPNTMMKACEPKDITDRIIDFCEYNNIAKELTYDVMDYNFHLYFDSNLHLPEDSTYQLYRNDT